MVEAPATLPLQHLDHSTTLDQETTMNDHPLGDITPDLPTSATTADVPPVDPLLPLTVDQVLDMARRVEKVAHVCLRADLTAEHDELVRQLSTLVDVQGHVIEDPEASVGDTTAASRARDLHDRLTAVRKEMAGAMWSVRFRAMDSEEWPVFHKQHYPSKEGESLTDFHNLLVAETAIDPVLTLEQVRKLRKAFGPPQFAALVEKAIEACKQGGLDVPKLSSSLLGLTQL